MTSRRVDIPGNERHNEGHILPDPKLPTTNANRHLCEFIRDKSMKTENMKSTKTFVLTQWRITKNISEYFCGKKCPATSFPSTQSPTKELGISGKSPRRNFHKYAQSVYSSVCVERQVTQYCELKLFIPHPDTAPRQPTFRTITTGPPEKRARLARDS